MNIVERVSKKDSPAVIQRVYRSRTITSSETSGYGFEEIIDSLMRTAGYHEHLRLWRLFSFNLPDDISAFNHPHSYKDLSLDLFELIAVDPNVFTWTEWFNEILRHNLNPFDYFEIQFFRDRVLFVFHHGYTWQRVVLFPMVYIMGKRDINEVWPL